MRRCAYLPGRRRRGRSALAPHRAQVHAEFRADRLSYWSTLSSWDAESKARAALNLNLNARLDPRMSGGRRIHRAQARVPRDLAELQRCDDFRALHVLGDFGAETAEVEVGLVVLRGDIYVRGADGLTESARPDRAAGGSSRIRPAAVPGLIHPVMNSSHAVPVRARP